MYIRTVLFIALLKNISGFVLLNVVSGMVIMFIPGAILQLSELFEVLTTNHVLTSIQYLFFRYNDTLCAQYSGYFCKKLSFSVIGVDGHIA
ncbi:hypothetical protein IJL65_02690 [bacterium]|nr:hypothetical protein [bacterium]